MQLTLTPHHKRSVTRLKQFSSKFFIEQHQAFVYLKCPSDFRKAYYFGPIQYRSRIMYQLSGMVHQLRINKVSLAVARVTDFSIAAVVCLARFYMSHYGSYLFIL